MDFFAVERKKNRKKKISRGKKKVIKQRENWAARLFFVSC